jgi:hypothetical protein
MNLQKWSSYLRNSVVAKLATCWKRCWQQNWLHLWCLFEGCKSVAAELAAGLKDAKVWWQNWLLVERGVAAELAPCWNGIVVKLAALSKDAKVWWQNWLLVERGVAAELAACWKWRGSKKWLLIQKSCMLERWKRVAAKIAACWKWCGTRTGFPGRLQANKCGCKSGTATHSNCCNFNHKLKLQFKGETSLYQTMQIQSPTS